MLKYTKEDYITRIRNANPLQLIIITYELVLVNLTDAKVVDEQDVYEKHIKKSQDFLMQLMSSLDMSYPISDNLLDIYLFVNKKLHEIYFHKNIEKIDECIEIMGSLLDSFELIQEKEVDLKPIVQSSQTVYAGLTYENGELSEMILENMATSYHA